MSTRSLVPFFASLALAACGPAPPGERILVEQQETARPADTTTNPVPAKYPEGPYGYLMYSTLPNLQFVGRTDTNGDGLVTKDDTVRVLRLSDFYGREDVKVLALMVAAEWCKPCNDEQGELVSNYSKYKDEKTPVEFLELLVQNTEGAPADVATVDRWTKKTWTDQYSMKSGLRIPFTVAADPTYASQLMGVNAYPTQFVIQTSDMSIQYMNAGYGRGVLEQAIEVVLESQ